jgi:hypothetical protein
MVNFSSPGLGINIRNLSPWLSKSQTMDVQDLKLALPPVEGNRTNLRNVAS